MDDSGVCPDWGTGIFGDPRLLELGRWVTEEVVACYFVALNLGLNFFVYFILWRVWLFISLFIAVQI